MRSFVFRYTYGDLLDKEYIQGITCPVCGQNKLLSMGRLSTVGWGFKCQICGEVFYVKIESFSTVNRGTRAEQ